MKLQRCSKGHFYDGDKYASCPHCEGALGAGGQTVPLDRNPSSVSSGTWPGSMGVGMDEGVTMPLDSGFDVGGQTIPLDTTMGSWPGAFDKGSDITKPLHPTSGPNDETVPVPPTESYPPRNNEQTSPSAGWLVCIKGKHMGRDFRLHMGRNTVGRGENNSVALHGDNTVSRDTQAVVVYDPHSNRFFATPGMSKSLCYVNGQVLLGQIELKKNDILELGDTKLMLIPCCDDGFNWNSVFDK